jgi:CHAT domain-containing protein
MTRKRRVFFNTVLLLWKTNRLGKGWLTQFLLVLMTAFLCITLSLVFTKTTAVYSAVPSGQNSLAQTQNLVQQGKNFYDAGQFAQAVKVLQQATAAKANGDELNQAIALSNLSLAYQQLGQLPQAESAIAQSFNLLQTEQNIGTAKEQLQILAQALDVRGRLQLAQGQSEAALTTWQQAFEIYTKIGDKAGLTRNRINQAQARQALGHYRQAQKTLAALELTLRKQPDSALKATGLRSLGNVLRVVGNFNTSRQVLEKSLAITKRMGTPSAQAVSDTLLSLGNTARAQQDVPAALKFYQQAATASVASNTRIQAQLNQLSLLLETKQWNAAEQLYPQIQPSIANLPSSRTAVDAKINFAKSLTRLKQHDTTIAVSWQDIAQLLATSVQQAKALEDQRAISYALGNLGELYEQNGQWNEAQNLTQQALFAAQTINATDITYLWQWQLGRLLRERGNIQAAIAAYTEAVNNLRSLRSDLVAVNPDIQFSFRDRVEPVYRQLVDLLLRPETGSNPSPKNLQTARTTIESLQLAELENFFRSACLDAKPELVDLFVDKGDRTAAVIYPIILPDRLEVILKLPTQKDLRHYATKKSQVEVEKTLELLMQYLKEPDRTNDVQKLSQQLYSWLIQPLEVELEKMQVTKLVFVLDGSLRNVPMGVLYDDKQQKYLLQKYAIALAPGLQLLEPKPLQRERLSALTAGLSEPREVAGIKFPRLQNVLYELKQIESQVPKSQKLFNQTFTTANIQNQIDSNPFTVVHMATHGQFSSNLEKTFILTWDRLLKIDELDNLLRTSDHSRSSAIELLVLSACETAAGDNRAALGLAGIAVRAGARSTLATLWQVDDLSTARLMSEFYRQLADPKLTKAEALQKAQLALWNDKTQDWKRPYFWAAYVLVGNWL